MKIIHVNVMRGPNYWSGYRKKLIVMKLDLQKYEQYPTHTLDGFYDRLRKLMPSLHSHRCSSPADGGFFERVKEGTWMGHVIEHVALELQSLAGMECGFGRTRETSVKGVYHVVFSYEIENAGKCAATAAVELVQSVISGSPYDLDGTIDALRRIKRREEFGPSTQAILDEAAARNIPFTRLDKHSLVMLGQGNRQKIIRAGIVCTTSNIGVDLVADKDSTKRILDKGFVPVPRGTVVQDPEELDEAIDDLKFPLVIKPLDGNHGRGVTTNIISREQAIAAFERAKSISYDVIVERFVRGRDFRFLVVNFKLVAAAERTPAMITGDGEHTIEELVAITNTDPRRGEGHEKVMTAIRIDEGTLTILRKKNLTPQSVLPAGKNLHLKDTANMSTGGTASDVTDLVHPHNVFLAERTARLLDINVCGIDVIAENISEPISEENGAILEVNASPGLRMHLAPTHGIARNVAKPIIDMLYPAAANGRIPIIAVTGTNGKTTTVRLIAHIAQSGGHTVGYTTTDGVYINDETICRGDCSGPTSAHTVLRDPGIDFAVLECARGGILRSGLGFDQCDVGIVTNVTADHLGISDIHTLDELACVKRVVPRSVHANGYAILNADDDLVYAMRRKLDCHIAFFSMSPDNARITAHCEKGGLAAILDQEYITLCKGKWKTRIAKVDEVPLTFGGSAECMIKNVLAAVLAAVTSGFSEDQVTKGLRSFVPSADKTPGRMNLFHFDHCTVMVDYAHNAGAYAELKKYLSTVKAPRIIGIVAATGDRRDEDIRDVGAFAAAMFDDIIIRHDTDGRGRTNENMSDLIIEGVQRVNPAVPVKIISDEFEALQFAMDHSPQGAFILLCADQVHTTLEHIRNLQKGMGQRVHGEEVFKAVHMR